MPKWHPPPELVEPFWPGLSDRYNMALIRTLPHPTDEILPSLMAEVCLVLAPDGKMLLRKEIYESPNRQGMQKN